ncbi:alpha,alpha-trehalase TreF [Pelagerythrobacter rhizovicinus]|uniref:alpha,alpha-trehalase TreF n=1 Tax=Pelagerythrobacter rhizovicinus TaxID=2268576 RepID=UPI001CDD7FBF|nr:alpha,alpha-trehalase TreF [Pelagerythrobacter rhizovicinus]
MKVLTTVNARIRGWRAARWLLAPASAVLLAGCAHPQSAPQPREPHSPSEQLAELYPRLALSGLFEDGKALADAVPRAEPARILEAYRAARPLDEAGLERFFEAHFRMPRPAPLRQPAPGLPLIEHIEALWPILTRRSPAVPAHGSLLALPNPYLVPGGRFQEIYYWDSYFTMLGFGDAQRPLKRAMVDNFAHLLRTFGRIPNGNRTYYLSRSQPPFFFKMVELTNQEAPAKAFAAYLPELKAEHRFWMAGAEGLAPGSASARVVRMENGALLNRYWDDRDSPRDESYAADVATAKASRREPSQVYRSLRAGAESGWDFSSRWFADGRSLPTIRTVEIVPPDLNSLLFGLEHAIADGCRELRDEACTSAFERRARMRRAAMQRYLWNERTGLFDDYQWREGRLLGNVTAAALYPLFFQVADTAQAARTAATVEAELLKPGGLVTSNRTTGEQWDAPNGWAPLQWIAVSGLRHYGHDELARTIAARWLDTVSGAYGNTGKLLEKYDVITRRPGGGGEYPLQDGFGWTNGVTVALARLYPELLETPASPAEGELRGTAR